MTTLYDIVCVAPLLQVSGATAQFTPLVVVAHYDCLPDRKDELGFREGERIVVTRKINSDWWVRSIPSYLHSIPHQSQFHSIYIYTQQGHVEGEPARLGVFPVNYVQISTSHHQHP